MRVEKIGLKPNKHLGSNVYYLNLKIDKNEYHLMFPDEENCFVYAFFITMTVTNEMSYQIFATTKL